MAIKNYTTKVPAGRSIEIITKSLVDHGAIGVMTTYEKETGKISGLQFLLEIKGRKVPFSLPVNWRLFQEVLKQQGIKRWDDEDYCYRVAWKNIHDWVLSQMALYETEMVELPQVFLPFATDDGGNTIYDKICGGDLLLDSEV